MTTYWPKDLFLYKSNVLEKRLIIEKSSHNFSHLQNSQFGFHLKRSINLHIIRHFISFYMLAENRNASGTCTNSQIFIYIPE